MSVWDFGDFHANEKNERYFLEEDLFPEQKDMTKEDVLIINGDVGLLRYFPNESKYYKDIKNREWFASKNYTTLCIMGNHENWYLYNELPIIDKWGGKVKVLSTDLGDIFIAITGEVYTICNKTFFVVNGATSIDYKDRTIGVDLFEEENLSYRETYIVEAKAKEVKKVTFLLTHTCSQEVIGYFSSGASDHPMYKCKTSQFLAYLDTILDYDENLFGHLHKQKSITISNKTYSCFYKTKPRKIC